MTTWSDPGKAGEYVERIATVPQRLAGEAVLAEILPTAPRCALDLGCGDGRLIRLLLDARPDVEVVVGVDLSPPMLRRRTIGSPATTGSPCSGTTCSIRSPVSAPSTW